MRRSPLLVVLLLSVLAAVALLFWPRAEAGPGPTAGDPDTPTAQPIGDVADSAGAGDQQPTPAVAERQPFAADTVAIADRGALVRVTARNAARQPQPGVMITAQPLHGNRISPPVGKGLTDERGQIEFADVEPCKLYLSTDRRDQKNVDVGPGLNEVDFEVKAGIDVQGRVLDPAGAPVAGATIWLQTADNSWDGGRVFGETATDGTFALVHVAPNCSLGAFASGFGPSPLIDLEVVDQSAPPARVELRLRREGGDLTGRVRDHAGAPIAGAQVAVGDQSGRADYQNDRVIEVWGVRTVETGGDGRYTVVGVPTGNNVVTARAPGFGIRRGETQITAGATATLDLTLERGAVLFGTVTNKDGAPEAGARIRVYDREPGTHFIAGGQIDFDFPFGHVETVADAHGSYRLAGVTPGTDWSFAQRRQHGGFEGVSVAVVRATLEVAAGSEVRWDPVIDIGRAIAGVVRYHDGYPIPYLFITLHDERTGDDQVINSDKEGAFRFLCLDDSSYEIRVQPPFDAPRGNTPPRRSGIVPDQGPLEITVEYDKPRKEVPGTVRGRVADAGARIRNPMAVSVTVNSDAGWFRPGIKVVDGTFRVEKVEPCRFRVILKEEETVLASTETFELVAAGDVDVGVLTTEPGGALRIRVARATGAEGFDPKLYLRRDGDPLSTTVAPGRSESALVESLTPGSYEVSGYFKGMLSVKTTTTVSAGQTSELTIDLRPGATGKVEVWWPTDHASSKRRGYKITDAAGVTVQEYEGMLATMPTRPYPLSFTLAAGRHHLAFWTDDDLRGELDFEIPASLAAPALRLDLH